VIQCLLEGHLDIVFFISDWEDKRCRLESGKPPFGKGTYMPV
jgi:hypothetical protein